MTIAPNNLEVKLSPKKMWYVEGRSDTWENEKPINIIVAQYYTTDIDDAIDMVKRNYDEADTWTIEEIDLADL